MIWYTASHIVSQLRRCFGKMVSRRHVFGCMEGKNMAAHAREEELVPIAEVDVLADEVLRRRIARLSLQVFASALALVLAAAFFTATPFLGTFGSWLFFLAALAASLAAHEGVHALFFRLLHGPGGHIGFGFAEGMLYTRAEGVRLSKGKFVCVLLAPAVLVSAALAILGLPSGHPVECALVAGCHLSGCAGDWEMVREIALTPGTAAVEDTDSGCRLLGHAGKGARKSP